MYQPLRSDQFPQSLLFPYFSRFKSFSENNVSVINATVLNMTVWFSNTNTDSECKCLPVTCWLTSNGLDEITFSLSFMAASVIFNEQLFKSYVILLFALILMNLVH